MTRDRPWHLSSISRAERAVVDSLLRIGPQTHAGLVTRTALSRTTIHTAVLGLRKQGLIEQDEQPSRSEVLSTGHGPRPLVFRLSPDAGIAVGVEVGRRTIQVVVASVGRRELHVGAAEDVGASTEADPRAVLEQAARLVQEALARVGDHPVHGVGVGLPMPLDLHGRLSNRAIMPAWADIDPRRELAEHLGDVPVHVMNDASLGALGEYVFGGADRPASLLYVKLGTGIGAGIVMDGQVVAGATGLAAEFGHVSIDPNGIQCRCGNRGCLERYAGGRALVQRASDAGLPLDGVHTLVRLAREGDPMCRRLIGEAGTAVGTALGAAVNLIDPGSIVLGGSLSAGEAWLLPAIKQSLQHTSLRAVDTLSLRTARTNRLASAWGAVGLVIGQRPSADDSKRARGHAPASTISAAVRPPVF